MTVVIRIIVLICFILTLPGNSHASNRNIINLTYLDSLRQKVVTKDGKEIYIWMSLNDKDRNAMPVARTEDIARIAMMFFSHYEKFGDTKSLKRAREALDFLIYMQDESGLFSISLDSDGNNRKRAGDAPLLHTAYSFQALARGYRFYKKSDPILGAQLEAHLERTINRLKILFNLPGAGYNQFLNVHGLNVPAWFINGRSDITAVFVLGLLDYYLVNPRADVKELIHMYCEAISLFSGDNHEEFPFCAYYQDIRNFTSWTLSSNKQISALAIAGSQFGVNAWTESAERAVNSLYTHFLASYGPICGMAPGPIIFPQEPSSCEVMTENLITLYTITGKRNYAIMAGLAASWLLGNNNMNEPIYDSVSGKAYEYLEAKRKSVNSSAAATANALLTLTSIWNTISWDYLEYREKLPPHTFCIMEAEEGKPVRKNYEITEFTYPGGAIGKNVVIKRENSFWIKFEIKRENEYDFYLIFLKQQGLSMGTSIMMRIDGDKIFIVPLGGSPDTPYMVMKEVVEPRLLLPGYHSLGIRFSGLLHSRAAIIDGVVLQPAIEWRSFSNPSGQTIALVKSFLKERRDFRTENLDIKNLLITSYTLYSSMGNVIQSDNNPRTNPSIIEIPEYGYGIILGK